MIANGQFEKELDKNILLQDFGAAFKSVEFQRNTIIGSNAYSLEEWNSGESIKLVRKQDWWGSSVSSDNHWFDAHPDTLIFIFQRDEKKMERLLLDAKVDVATSIDIDVFKNNFQDNIGFETFTPDQHAYDLIMFNHSNPIFQDKKTRQALAHLMNREVIIDSILHGLGGKADFFVNPNQIDLADTSIIPHSLDIEKAKELLREADWKYEDNAWYKDINGKKYPLEFSITTNLGNKRREKTCEVFKENAMKAGVIVHLDIIPFIELIPKIRNGAFETVVLGFMSSPLLSDPKQLWHTEGRGNYGKYSHPRVDELIDMIRVTYKRNELGKYYQELHRIFHEDVPAIFTVRMQERVVVNKKFKNVLESEWKPGLWLPSLQLRY